MKVLIVGAGIGGDTLAALLGRAGHEVTVVEIAPELRSGGQTVDMRGGSREVLARMGLLDECLAHLVEQRGIAWIDADGKRLADMPVETLGGKGFVSSEELLRTDLARVIHAACPDRVTHVFGDTVESLTETTGGVRVTFRKGLPETYDLVVGADGTHSRVRSLTFGPEEDYRRPLGLAHAWFTLAETPETPALDGWFLVHQAPGRLLVDARPGHAGEQEIGFSFPATSLPPRGEARFALLDRVFAGTGWRTRELLAAARTAPDFALDTLDQIVMPSWHRGRVVLLGDSAWCASPLSGLGTALALIGAEALATALSSADTLPTAFARFEETMLPQVRAAQKMFPGRVAMYAPKTTAGIHFSAAMMRFFRLPPVESVLTRLAS